MAKYDKVQDEHEVTRWLRKKHLARDDDNNVILDGSGRPKHIFPQAFKLRENEDSLSLTNVHYFLGQQHERRKLAADATRLAQHSKKLNLQDAFGFATCEGVIETCQRHGSKVRIIEDPVDGNDAHCVVTSYPEGVGLLQEQLADETFESSLLFRDLK